MTTFVVKPVNGEEVEIEADRGEQSKTDSRVTFYKGDNAIGSFINVERWHEKAAG